MDKITLAELSAYLPYGLRFYNGRDYEADTLKGIKSNSYSVPYVQGSRDSDYFRFEKIKPLLRPLSDLYKEMEHEGERFVPAENLFNQYELKFGDNGDFYLDYYSIGETDSPWTGYGIIQQLLEWHFDVFGLIDRGMSVAIERGTNV